MDAKNLIKESKARFDLHSQKKQLKEKYQSKLLFAEQGGLWEASPEFIGNLSSLNDETVILVDKYENPIKVNREELLIKANQIYTDVMSKWHEEYQLLESKR